MPTVSNLNSQADEDPGPIRQRRDRDSTALLVVLREQQKKIAQLEKSKRSLIMRLLYAFKLD